MLRLRQFAARFGILFLVFFPLLNTSTASADTVAGLTVEVYTYDPSSTPDRKPYTLCETGWTSVANINDWNGDVVTSCQEDFVVVHYSGWITTNATGSILLQSWADDGFYLEIDGIPVIDDWYLKGCGGSQGYFPVEAGVSQKFDAWFYEYGGGQCNILQYQIDSTGLHEIPDEWFTHEAVAVVPPVIVEPPVIPVDPPIDPVDPPVEPVDPVIPVDPLPPIEPPVVPVVPVDPTPVLPVPEIPVKPQPEPEIPVLNPVQPLPPIIVPPAPIPQPSSNILTVDPSTIDPASLTQEDVVALQAVANETLATSEEGSKEYNMALEQLAVAAQADDIVVDPQLAAVPVLGAAVVGITNALNALGNLGADMSPAHRKAAKQQVLVSVVAVGAAVQAAAMTTSAAAAAGSTTRKKQ